MPQPPSAGAVRGDPRLSPPSRRALFAIGLVALAVRLAYVLVARPVVLLVSDGQTYHLLADNLAAGRGYIAPYEWLANQVVRPTAEFGPVHPALLAAGALLGARSVLAHQVFLAVVGSSIPVLTAVLAARLTGDRGVAVASGLVAAFHPMLFGSDGALMSETTYTLLGLLAVLALLRLAEGGGRRWAVATGVAVGLAVLTRGDALLLLPFVVVPVLWGAGRRVDRRLLVGVGTVVGVAAVVVLPWVGRNAARFDGRLVLSNNLGSLLNGSNCPEAYAGPSTGAWDFGCAYRAPLAGTDEASGSMVLRDSGLRYLREHADRLPVVIPARVARAWGFLLPVSQARGEVTDGRVLQAQVVGVVADWLLLPLFVVGVVALHRRRRPVAPLVGLVAMVTVLVAATYGSSRFREVAEPALIIGAMAGVRLLFPGAPPSLGTGDPKP